LPATNAADAQKPTVFRAKVRRVALPRRWSRLVAGTMLCALAGCEDAPEISPAYQVADVRSYVSGAIKDGPLLVVARGVVLGQAGDALAHITLGGIREAMTWTADPRLTLDPGRAALPSFRIVAVFNEGVDAPCGAFPSGGAIEGHRGVTLVMAFCAGRDELALVRGRLRALRDPAARLQALVRHAASDLLAERHDG
jgi:hypothetical protein